jgi:hypothetical protein
LTLDSLKKLTLLATGSANAAEDAALKKREKDLAAGRKSE